MPGGCRACKAGEAARSTHNHGETVCSHHIARSNDDNFAKKADRNLYGTANAFGPLVRMTNAQCAAACMTKTYPKLGSTDKLGSTEWDHPDYDNNTCGEANQPDLNAQCVEYSSAAEDDCNEYDSDCYRPNTSPQRRYSDPRDGDTCYGYEIKKYNTDQDEGGTFYTKDTNSTYHCELWTVPFVWTDIDPSSTHSLKYECGLSSVAQGHIPP